MWIELADDLPETFETPNLEICSVLEAVASASFHGRHLLYGSSKTLKWLGEQDISGPAKAAAARAYSRVAEHGALRACISKRVIIRSTGMHVEKCADGWQVPIRTLIGVPFQESELLAENLRDGEVFRLSAKHYRRNAKIGGVGITLSLRNGGGNEIAPCFRATVAERRALVLTITDSDLDHPKATSGLSSRTCGQIADTAQWICEHVELPCREVENLLPLNLVEDSILADLPEATQVCDKLQQLKSILATRPDSRRYADLKEGVLGFFSTGTDGVVARREYWKSVVTDSGPNHRVTCNDNCPHTSHKSCNCLISEGLGENTVPRFLDHCRKLSDAKQMERIQTSINADDWMKIGEDVFRWGIADQPIRV